MTRSYSKIELYNVADVLKHTITSTTNNGALSIHTHDVLTTDVGSFAFTLPLNPPLYLYNDVAEHWTAKVYLNSYKPTLASDLVIAGRIQKITGPLQTEQGYTRVFECKGLGEILERRHKKNKRYQAVEADDIVAEVASDLSLTGDLATDTTAETITVRTESYFDLLKKVSDYWASAGTQVKKDFYVSPAGVLVWKARPIRTSGVEVLTVGQNIVAYKVTRDKLSLKNSITVLGADTAPVPTAGDAAESDDLWTAGNSTTITESGTDVKEGSVKIVLSHTTSYIEAECDFGLLTTRHINKLNFWQQGPALNPKVRIYAPDSSNYFEQEFDQSLTWVWKELALGFGTEYDADKNPTGWTETGSPNWYNITAVAFFTDAQVGAQSLEIDGLQFYPERWTSDAADGTPIQDATSIAAYGQHDAEYTDDNLLSALDCQKRANTLLYQLKDPIVRADVTVNGCTNIKIGDRIPLTIPAEDIAAENFDVVAVTHDFNSAGFSTVASMVDSANTRMLPPISNSDVVKRKIKSLQDVTSDLYSRIVR